jgi:hypothetical protein
MPDVFLGKAKNNARNKIQSELRNKIRDTISGGTAKETDEDRDTHEERS